MSNKLEIYLLIKQLLATVIPGKIAHSKFISALRGIGGVKFYGSKLVVVILKAYENIYFTKITNVCDKYYQFYEKQLGCL